MFQRTGVCSQCETNNFYKFHISVRGFDFGVFSTIDPGVGKVLSEKKDAHAYISLSGLLACFLRRQTKILQRRDQPHQSPSTEHASNR